MRVFPEVAVSPAWYALLFAGSSLLCMLALLEVGRRIGAQRLARDPEAARAGIPAVEGAVFGLLGLMIAFTFSGAALRLVERKQLITEEANCVGTAWLRVDLVPEDARPALRDRFRQYLDARLDVYRKLPDFSASREALARASRLQGEIWSQAAAACTQQNSAAATTLVLQSLNDMFDIANTRTMAARIHQPGAVFLMLFVMSLAGSLLAGMAMGGAKQRSWIHVVAFAGFTAATMYVIVDLEYPRFGLIRIDTFDQLLIDLRRSMGP